MTTDPISAIINKVQDLLKLSQSNNPHEAAAAAKAAETLIHKYRLTEADLSVKKDIKQEPVKDIHVLYETARVIRWKSLLSQYLAAHYGCAIYNDIVSNSSGRMVSRYRLVGQPSDLELTKFMFGWLTNEIARLANNNCKGQGMIVSQSYCEGAVAGIYEQLQAAKEEINKEVKDQAQITALATLDNRIDESIKKLRELVPKLKSYKKKTYRHIDGDAYSSGKEDGRNIHLAKGLGAANNSKLLK